MTLRICFRVVAALVLSGCALGAGQSNASQAKENSEAAFSRLVAAPIPYRNLYQLADQLKLHPPRPIARVVRHTSPNYAVGHQDTFWVLGEDADRYFKLRARIVAETPHLYIYVQDGTDVPAAEAQSSADIFEHKIYPTDRRNFGTEWNPGVDGDPHITCLVGDLRSSTAAGFYSAEDEYPKLVNPYSNQREMIYMNSLATSPGETGFNEILSHEFQHMIHWHMHPHDNAWLNEGMSMLAEYINHYPPTGEPDAFVSTPSTQLNTWTVTGESNIAHYGGSYLFLSYLYDRYGSSLIRTIVRDSHYTDLQLIDRALQQRHISETASQLFSQWVAANAIDTPASGTGVFQYRQLPHAVHISHHDAVPFSYHGSIPPWTARYFAIRPGKAGTIHLRFSGAGSVPAVSAGKGPFWWGSRGDMSDTRLERTVDLRKVRKATLKFRTWYDIEKNYDYGYVEASTDGKSWTTLPATTTTRTNPDGANYGNGFTGGSHGWRSERVNLSRYAGRMIHLRFEYITDDEYNGQGMVVKDITIPQIGFHDHLTGWTRAGFVPVIRNALPNHWTVDLIEETANGDFVTQRPVGSGDNLDLSINTSDHGGLHKLVAAVFTTAPKTTVRTGFSLSANG
ncbi:MAG: hypothetical protein ACRDFS_00530 [Chloroflexota bacterium]